MLLCILEMADLGFKMILVDQNALIFHYDKRILVRKIHNLCPMHTWLASF